LFDFHRSSISVENTPSSSVNNTGRAELYVPELHLHCVRLLAPVVEVLPAGHGVHGPIPFGPYDPAVHRAGHTAIAGFVQAHNRVVLADLLSHTLTSFDVPGKKHVDISEYGVCVCPSDSDIAKQEKGGSDTIGIIVCISVDRIAKKTSSSKFESHNKYSVAHTSLQS
jgi:hypothetical protein